MSKKSKDSAFSLLFKDPKRVVNLYKFFTEKDIDPESIEIQLLKGSWYSARLYNDVVFVGQCGKSTT